MKGVKTILIIMVIAIFTISGAMAYEADVYKAQKKLQSLGYKVGSPDGVFGKKTANALRLFQTRHGLPRTGKLDKQTKSLL